MLDRFTGLVTMSLNARAGHRASPRIEPTPERVEVADGFRTAMARLATPVSVVTTFVDGEPHGTTVSAFSSLSMSPPMVMMALDLRSALLARVKRLGRFALNVLTADQADIATRFAAKGDDRFAGVGWQLVDDLPWLDGVLAWVSCSAVDVRRGGDHEIVLGRVERSAGSSGHPLTYHERSFGTHVPHDS